MAEEIKVVIDVESNIDESTAKIKTQINEVKGAAEETKNSVNDLNEGASETTQLIDQATGGYAELAKRAVGAFKFIRAQISKNIAASKEWVASLSFSNLSTKVKAFGVALKASFKSGAIGAKALRGALIATGIGALVVAVGTIVAYWDDIVDAVTGYNSELDKAADAATASRKAQEGALQAISDSENILREQGKSEEDIQKLKEAQTQEVIKAAKIELQALKTKREGEIESYKKQKAFVEGMMNFLLFVPKMVARAIDGLINSIPYAVREVLGIGRSNIEGSIDRMVDGVSEAIIGTADEAVEETNQLIAEQEQLILKLENDAAGYRLQRRQAAKDAATKRQEDADEAAKKQLEKQQELQRKLLESEANYQGRLLDAQKQLDELVYNQQLSAEQQEINAVYDKFFAIEEAYAENAEILKQIEDQRNKEIAEINKTYREKEADELDTYNKKEQERAEMLRQFKVDSAFQTLSILRDLNTLYDKDNEEAARRAFQREKALNLAETIITTYTAAQKAYTSQLNPLDPTSLGRAQIAAGLAVASGLARAAVIARQKFEPSGGSSSLPSAQSAPSVTGLTPQFNIVGTSGTNQLAQSIGSQFDRPLRAYVVGGDVTTSQELERKRIKIATFG